MAVEQAKQGAALEFPPQQDGRKPLAHEVLSINEFFLLTLSPVYRGIGVPRGDNSPVMVIPGLYGPDYYLLPMKEWLIRMGYKSYDSGISFIDNNLFYFDPHRHLFEIDNVLQRIVRERKQPVTLIGHSLGGLYARIMAQRRPELISRLIGMGSPFKDPEKSVNQFLLTIGKLSYKHRGIDELEGLKEELSMPLPSGINLVSIHTRTDGVVNWTHCLDDDLQAQNIEVSGTHTGLVWNPQVYEHIAHILASVPEKLSTSPSSLKFAA